MKREFIVKIDYVGDIPPDNEEIVRCKYCRHYEPEDKLCCHPFGAVVGKIPENFYCGYGEHKESR